jgi:solute carrier family 25 protein 14/30
MGGCIVQIVRLKGPLGLYAGFGAQWARFGPYAIIQFITWEKLRDLCGIPPL